MLKNDYEMFKKKKKKIHNTSTFKFSFSTSFDGPTENGGQVMC